MTSNVENSVETSVAEVSENENAEESSAEHIGWGICIVLISLVFTPFTVAFGYRLTLDITSGYITELWNSEGIDRIIERCNVCVFYGMIAAFILVMVATLVFGLIEIAVGVEKACRNLSIGTDICLLLHLALIHPLVNCAKYVLSYVPSYADDAVKIHQSYTVACLALQASAYLAVMGGFGALFTVLYGIITLVEGRNPFVAESETQGQGK